MQSFHLKRLPDETGAHLTSVTLLSLFFPQTGVSRRASKEISDSGLKISLHWPDPDPDSQSQRSDLQSST